MIILAAAISISIFSFFVGFMLAGLFKIDIKISKKEEYEAKIKTFEALIEDLQHKLTEAETDVELPKEKKYHPLDMFPANLGRDYGLPRSLDEEV